MPPACKLNWNNAARVEWEFAAAPPHPYAPPTRTMTYTDDNQIATFNGQSVTHDADGTMTYGITIISWKPDLIQFRLAPGHKCKFLPGKS